MATTRTVAQLLTSIRQRSDTVELTVRHTDAKLAEYLTQSLRGVRNELLSEGMWNVLNVSTAAALPTAAPVAGEDFLEVDWPTNAVEIWGVDVNDGSRWYDLEPLAFGQRRDYQGRTGPPQAFFAFKIPIENPTTPTTSLDAGKLQIYPLNTLGLSYRVHFIPAFPELSSASPTNVVQGFDGDWIEWAVWDAAIKVLFDDDEMDPTQYQEAATERAKVEKRMFVNAKRMNRAGPITLSRADSNRRFRGR